MVPLFKPFQVVLAVGSALAAVYYSCRLFSHASAFMLDDHAQLCGNSEWAWSLYSNCFRSGFLWPALLMLSTGLAAFVLAVSLLFPSYLSAADSTGFANDGDALLARFSVGNMKTPVRRPSGPVAAIDNRLYIGTIIVMSLAAQTILFSAWQYNTSASNINALLYSKELSRSTLLFFALSFVCLVVYARSNRLFYAGLFPWILPALISIQLVSGLTEIYFSFFTAENSNVPIFGRNATVHSNFLVSTTVFNLVLVVLFSSVQWRAIFICSLDGSDRNITSDQAYTPIIDDIDSTSNDETTPLAHFNDQKEIDLVDTPEFNSSWFDRVTFSWPNSLLRMGATRQLGHLDLFRLDHPDQPMTNWKRYMHYRKPDRSLVTSIGMTFAPEFLVQAALTLIRCIVRYASPFFLQRILRSIENSGSSEKISRGAYIHAFGLLFFSLLNIAVTNQSMWIGRRIGMRLKGLLVAELSTKTLCRCGEGSWEKNRKNDSMQGRGAGKDVSKIGSTASNGKIMNLLTADLKQVTGVISYLDNIIATPITFFIGVWYMYRMLGISALIGLSITAVYAPLSKKFFAGQRQLKKKQSASSDERVSVITELLQGIKSVKLFGWESRLIQKVDERRERQLDYAWKISLWKTAINISASLSPMLLLAITFTAYVALFGNKMTAEIAFTSISVLQMVRTSMVKLPKYTDVVINGYVALGRIDSYLSQPQIQDLEKRVALRSNNFLGFECANLEWGNAGIAKASSNADAQNLATASKATTAIGTPDGELSNNVNQPTEETPLLAGLPYIHVALPDASSMVSLDGQNNNSVFSLKYIDVQFPIGGLSIVAGPTGCGKSSLLSALIGEMTLTHGHVLLPTVDASMIAASNSKYRDVIELSNEGLAICDIAYVAQKAWLRNATIRENILFGEPYDKDRYEEVLHACALKPDLRILKAGDMTEIGERGVTLSGGQQQRVALARAVYSSRRILLIDDCLSAVDAHTGKHILMECLLNKTSLMKDRTRVLVTHHVAMCLPFAQFLVVMKDGQIMLKGCPTDLEMRGLISGTLLDKQHKDNSTTDDSSDKTKNVKGKSAENKPGHADKNTTAMKLAKMLMSESEDEYNLERLKKIAEQKGIDPNSNLSALQGILVDEEKREEGYVKFEVWKTYILACGNKFFWMSIMIILIISELILALSKYWIRVWVASTSNSIIGFHTTDTASLGAISGANLFYTLGYIYNPAAYVASSTGIYGQNDMLSIVSSNFNSNIQLKHHSSAYWLGIYVLIGILHTAWSAAMWLVIFFGSLKASRDIHKRLIRSIMHATPRFFDTTPIGRIINRFSGDMHTIDNGALDSIVIECTTRVISVLTIYVIVSWILPLFAIVAVTITLVYAAWIDAGLAGFILSYALVFSEKMLMLIREYSSSEMKMNSVERIRQYLSIEQEAALESELGHEPPASWPTKGDLQIENLVAEYMPGVPVLHSISLSVKHGEKIGVVGRTGAGKSTLSLALLRFVEASSGCILLDGVDISKIGLEELRRSVTIVPQDPVLFNGTIRFNLDPFNEYPDVILWDALRRTHLVRENSSQNTSRTPSINEGANSTDGDTPLLERMSGIFSSLDAEIKENGQNLSLGQRQLVALARALVRRSRLIIMDEATASVDFDTDDRIQRTIRGYEFANSTLLCIAHRLRTIIDYDRVLVLDNGKVAEFDTPYSLLQNKGGIFRNMCTNSGEYENLLVTAGRKRSTGS
ncbi:hypothetical protein GGI25_000492 [Coemansia spiralis]|uniref:P-loop containing nucleoside triphosphate hydrolase protein n=1 Tax=Coemansia spiralis TaxID=417178 RepID=A0A9W8G752_9FUNG|nr:hypothetical protein GGI25_000492 [Coemansia spiralis]